MSMTTAATARRWMRACIAVAMLSLALVPAAQALTGGPSAYGYTWIDRGSPGGPNSDGIRFTNIASSGTPLTLVPDRDDGTATISLPFPFRFHGVAYTQASVCANGFLAMGGSTLCDALPHNNSGEPTNYIAAWWADLDGRCAGADVDYQVLGTAPHRRVVVQWTGFGHYNNQCGAAQAATFQVVLHETSHAIEVLHSGTAGTNATPHYVEIAQTSATALTAHSAATSPGTDWGVMFLPPPENASSAAWTCSSPRLAIPDNASGGIGNSLTIPSSDTRVITDLDAFVSVPHSYVGDVTLRLVHVTTGTTVPLVNAQCGGSHNIVSLVLDDSAAAAPTCQAVAAIGMAGIARAYSTLATFGGESVAGEWRLQAIDASSADVGTLMQWCLSFTGVAAASQTIDFTLPFTTRERLQTPVAFTPPTASSGLPVAVASLTPSVCTVSGASIALHATGTCSLQATQGGDANYAAAEPVVRSFTVTTSAQSIVFAPLPDRSRFDVPFGVTASATSGLTVAIASTTPAVCTVSSFTVTLQGVGMCTLRATQAGNGDYAAATPVEQSFAVTAAGQAITFDALPDRSRFDAPFAVSATASSGLDVVIESTTPDVCTVAAHIVTLAGVGTCTLRATQPGDDDYAAATPVEQSFAVAAAGQAITFDALPDRARFDAPFAVSAVASSGLDVVIESTTPDVCTVAAHIVTLAGVGTCALRATQSGDDDYAAAAPVERSFAVTGAEQTMTFPALPDRSRFDAPFAVSATASSGLDVAVASITSEVCTVAANIVTLVGVGTCTLRATQPGDDDYAAAMPVERSFAVTPAEQTITFEPLANVAWSATPVDLDASASSGLPVALSSDTPATCAVDGDNVSLLGVGRCELRAEQAGNADYAAATPAVRGFDVLAPEVSIRPAQLPPALTQQPYAADLTAEAYGDVPPYALVLLSGTLPPGLHLASEIGDGPELSGTPTVEGSYQFTVGVADGTPAAAGGPFVGERTYVVVVLAAGVFVDGFETVPVSDAAHR